MLSTVLEQDRNNGNGYPLHRQLKSSSIFISASLSWKWSGKKVTCVPYTGQILAFLITKMLQTNNMWAGRFTLLLQKRRWNLNLLSFLIYCYMHRTPLHFTIYTVNFSSPPIKCTHMNWAQRNGLFWLLWQAGQHCCLKKKFQDTFSSKQPLCSHKQLLTYEIWITIDFPLQGSQRSLFYALKAFILAAQLDTFSQNELSNVTQCFVKRILHFLLLDICSLQSSLGSGEQDKNIEPCNYWRDQSYIHYSHQWEHSVIKLQNRAKLYQQKNHVVPLERTMMTSTWIL